LLLASVFTITFSQLRWNVGAADIGISDVAALLFLIAFAGARIARADYRVPRATGVLLAFFTAFAVVYLAGFFDLETVADRNLYSKGIVKFAIHFLLVVGGIAYLAERSERFYWCVLGWFVGGVAANGAYGLVELAVAETSGGNLDRTVLSAIGAYQRGGINVFGAVNGEEVFRTNALTLDPNHLGIMVIVPLLVLLPIYLRLERGHRLRAPLALTLAFLAVVELATLSRSGLLGIAVGLLVLAVPYRRRLLSVRFLGPPLLVAAVVGAFVSQRSSFFETVFRARTSVGSGTAGAHFQLYDLVGPVLGEHPLFGLGINTFSSYFEFVTGESNWGPHSYYIALLTETGIVGTALFLVYLFYIFRRLGTLRRLGRALSEAGDQAAARVRPLSWGLTAALAGTLAANAFYLTMQMYYFFVFVMLALAAPVVLARRAADRPTSIRPPA
jgi:hypothetical protein